MTKSKLWRQIANTFGSLAYIVMLLQWAWLVVTIILPILSEGPIKDFTTPVAAPDPSPVVELTIPPFMETLILIASILFAIGVIVYAVLMVPRSIGRAGHTTVIRAAAVTTKHITRHQTIKPSEKQSLIVRYIWLFKFLAALVPVVALAIPTSLSLDHKLVVIVGLFLASLSLISLGLQLAIAYLAKIPTKDLR